MQSRQLIMGMPITVSLVDINATQEDIDTIFTLFKNIDDRFSTYKKDSEISKFNRGEIRKENLSEEMREVFALSEKTRKETNGYFNVQKGDGSIDPSGMVKGWAIWKASKKLLEKGFHNFFIDAGGDIQVEGFNVKKGKWKIGIKNPFNEAEIVKVVALGSEGIATSGTYIRGQHIYNPHKKDNRLDQIVSLSVIGPNIYEADRFATAAFAMQGKGIEFVEKLSGFEGYMIDKDGLATYTSGFEKYVV